MGQGGAGQASGSAPADDCGRRQLTARPDQQRAVFALPLASAKKAAARKQPANLHVVLPKHPLAGIVSLLESLHWLGLADRHQARQAVAPPRPCGCRLQARLHLRGGERDKTIGHNMAGCAVQARVPGR